MHPCLLTLFFGALLLRLGSVAVSMRHEKALKAHGAREYGRSTSHLLAAAHAVFYGGALVEGLWRSTQPTGWTTVGLLLYGLSIMALVLVWRELKGLWTVKLMGASPELFPQYHPGISWTCTHHGCLAGPRDRAATLSPCATGADRAGRTGDESALSPLRDAPVSTP
jgi:hypothetical protein